MAASLVGSLLACHLVHDLACLLNTCAIKLIDDVVIMFLFLLLMLFSVVVSINFQPIVDDNTFLIETI